MPISKLTTAAKVLSFNLRFIRKGQNKTQADVAKSAKISFRLYQKLESGDANPTLETISRLANTLQVSMDRLFRLSHIEISRPKDKFLTLFDQNFKKFGSGAFVRSLDGDILALNNYMENIFSLNTEKNTTSLMKLYTLIGKTILKVQMNAEKKGQSMAYCNYIPVTRNTYKTMRFYPTLIYEKNQETHAFTALYISETDKDVDENYFKFCERLLKII